MLAEAIHSVADTGNQGLLFLGGTRSRRAPTAEHPFGFGPERYFWAFVVALVLFSLGSLFALVEGVDKLRQPRAPRFADRGVRGARRRDRARGVVAAHRSTAKRSRCASGRSWWHFIRTTKNAEIPVVLLEDTGALVGLGIALVGITLAEVTGDPRWDAVGSLGIGLLLGVIAVVLAIEMKSLLIGEAVTPEYDEQIRDRDRRTAPRSTRIIHLRTMHLGPDDVLVAAKLEFACDTMPALAARDRHRRGARASLGARSRRLIFIEPDIYRPGDPSDGHRGGPDGRRDATATVAAVDTFNEAFNRHDVDAVMAAMTDDCVFESTSPPIGRAPRGTGRGARGVGGLLRLVAHRALRRAKT